MKNSKHTRILVPAIALLAVGTNALAQDMEARAKKFPVPIYPVHADLYCDDAAEKRSQYNAEFNSTDKPAKIESFYKTAANLKGWTVDPAPDPMPGTVPLKKGDGAKATVMISDSKGGSNVQISEHPKN